MMHIIEGMHDGAARGCANIEVQIKKRGGTGVKKVDIRPYVLTLMGVAFVCLLLSGAPRLFAGDEPAVPLGPPIVRAARLCSPPAREQESGAQPARALGPGARIAMENHPFSCLGLAAGQVRRDANGNVLAACSYMRAVYQAFPLGDGFA